LSKEVGEPKKGLKNTHVRGMDRGISTKRKVKALISKRIGIEGHPEKGGGL